MPIRTSLLALAAVALAAACSSTPNDAAPAAAVDAPAAVDPPAAVHPADEGDPPVEAQRGATEVSLTIPVGSDADGVPLAIVVRSVEVGDRREVTMEAPDGVVDHHVIDGDDHWWWIPPAAREVSGGVEWIHLDVAEVAEVGELPDLVADARAPLPRPGDLAVGQTVAGHEVAAVERVAPDEELVHLAGLDEPAVVRVRALPARTRIDVPRAATELADLPEAVGWWPA